MSTLRNSLSYVLAGLILFAAAACERDASSITSPQTASLAKKPPAPPADTTPPTVPVLTATSVGTRYVTLAWHSTDNASQYISYRVTKDGVPITSSGFTWVSETSRTFTLLEPGTTYTFTAQARDNAQLLQALTKPANWGQTAKLQSEFLQASFQRTAQLGQRYVEVSSTFMTSALAIGWNQAKKVA